MFRRHERKRSRSTCSSRSSESEPEQQREQEEEKQKQQSTLIHGELQHLFLRIVKVEHLPGRWPKDLLVSMH